MFANVGDADGQGIAADSSYVYLAADGGSAFIENGTSGSAQLYIGQYLSREDRFGIAPVVQITGPAQGNTFVEGESIPIRVSATDDVAVASQFPGCRRCKEILVAQRHLRHRMALRSPASPPRRRRFVAVSPTWGRSSS